MVIPYKPGRCITDEKKQVAIFCRLHLFKLNAKGSTPNTPNQKCAFYIKHSAFSVNNHIPF